jgi:hypothetical protein
MSPVGSAGTAAPSRGRQFQHRFLGAALAKRCTGDAVERPDGRVRAILFLHVMF